MPFKNIFVLPMLITVLCHFISAENAQSIGNLPPLQVPASTGQPSALDITDPQAPPTSTSTPSIPCEKQYVDGPTNFDLKPPYLFRRIQLASGLRLNIIAEAESLLELRQLSSDENNEGALLYEIKSVNKPSRVKIFLDQQPNSSTFSLFAAHSLPGSEESCSEVDCIPNKDNIVKNFTQQQNPINYLLKANGGAVFAALSNQSKLQYVKSGNILFQIKENENPVNPKEFCGPIHPNPPPTLCSSHASLYKCAYDEGSVKAGFNAKSNMVYKNKKCELECTCGPFICAAFMNGRGDTIGTCPDECKEDSRKPPCPKREGRSISVEIDKVQEQTRLLIEIPVLDNISMNASSQRACENLNKENPRTHVKPMDATCMTACNTNFRNPAFAQVFNTICKKMLDQNNISFTESKDCVKK